MEALLSRRAAIGQAALGSQAEVEAPRRRPRLGPDREELQRMAARQPEYRQHRALAARSHRRDKAPPTRRRLLQICPP
jgi:hypothetical protein